MVQRNYVWDPLKSPSNELFYSTHTLHINSANGLLASILGSIHLGDVLVGTETWALPLPGNSQEGSGWEVLRKRTERWKEKHSTKSPFQDLFILLCPLCSLDSPKLYIGVGAKRVRQGEVQSTLPNLNPAPPTSALPRGSELFPQCFCY